jgi:hypothetical protein
LRIDVIYVNFAKMKQYVIDQLRDQDIDALEKDLAERFGPPALGRVYWVAMDPEYYSALQAAHEDCHPLCFALQLKPGVLAGEFLVRTHERIRCDCMGYANEAQRNWLISLMDSIVQQLDIPV